MESSPSSSMPTNAPYKELLQHAEALHSEGMKKLEGVKSAVGSRLAAVQAHVDTMRTEATRAVRHAASELQRRQQEQQRRLHMPAPGFAVRSPPPPPPPIAAKPGSLKGGPRTPPPPSLLCSREAVLCGGIRPTLSSTSCLRLPLLAAET